MDGLAVFQEADAGACGRLQEWLFEQGWYVTMMSNLVHR